jgi:hypothetical protein
MSRPSSASFRLGVLERLLLLLLFRGGEEGRPPPARDPVGDEKLITSEGMLSAVSRIGVKHGKGLEGSANASFRVKEGTVEMG